MFFILLALLQTVCAQKCVYYSRNWAVCQDLHSPDNFPKNVKFVLMKNCCDFQVTNWTKFRKQFSELDLIKFEPFCRQCLKIDENFFGIKIEGRCLENDRKLENIDQLSTISNEIVSCIVLLLTLTLLYTIRFIKYEILHQFHTFEQVNQVV